MIPEQYLCKGAAVPEFPRTLLQILAIKDSQDNPLTPFSKGEFLAITASGDLFTAPRKDES
jgi:hypothetical protein